MRGGVREPGWRGNLPELRFDLEAFPDPEALRLAEIAAEEAS